MTPKLTEYKFLHNVALMADESQDGDVLICAEDSPDKRLRCIRHDGPRGLCVPPGDCVLFVPGPWSLHRTPGAPWSLLGAPEPPPRLPIHEV